MSKEISYYIIIPDQVRKSEKLTATAKLIYGDILLLSRKKGYCYATNSHFANQYHISAHSVSRLINALQANGFIKSSVNKSEGNKRKIFPQIGIKEDNTNSLNTMCHNANSYVQKQDMAIDKNAQIIKESYNNEIIESSEIGNCSSLEYALDEAIKNWSSSEYNHTLSQK
ncbi:helix-turn-helix domain-containing protein [Aureibacter tunicatorum]|uniref:Helix-turn-helix domain-containing protein n=1 Tax=Aureibacter tunicatorum TaxID=866807 RepID=A0AAE4BUL9_9BACT|nr:helix-turn-helix domain-containing protein [Aureibacter tunicatorum]MDR6241901.1 hypothetical protein [Aureibacter tunicatorum]BDD07450.1 hypothetical protein AUTU_49330 [Aureibacter tunicatorum]